MVSSGETDNTGYGLTVIVTCAVEVHPSIFPITVYVVAEPGVAVTLEPEDALNVAAGLHV